MEGRLTTGAHQLRKESEEAKALYHARALVTLHGDKLTAAKPGDKDPSNGQFTKGNQCGFRRINGRRIIRTGFKANFKKIGPVLGMIMDKPASAYSMTKKLAEKLGLGPETEIREVLAFAIFAHSIKGKEGYLKEMLNRVEGKIVDKIEVTGSLVSEMSDEDLQAIASQVGVIDTSAEEVNHGEEE